MTVKGRKLGPPHCRFNSPLTASIASRAISASRRRGGNRQRSRLSESNSAACGLNAEDCRYVADKQNQFVHPLDAPGSSRPGARSGRTGRFHEFGCQPIEQFRMGRLPTVEAKVIGSVDQSLSEMVLPDPIHHHAGGQRITGIGNPIGKAESAFPLGRIGGKTQLGREGTNRRESAGGDLRPGFFDFASQIDDGRFRLEAHPRINERAARPGPTVPFLVPSTGQSAPASARDELLDSDP